MPHPMGKPLPRLTYTHLQPYEIMGGTTAIRQTFVRDATTVEALKDFPMAPDALLKRYASHRFVTQGTPLKLVFDIKKASLLKYIDKDNMVGYLSGAASDRYLLDIEISMFPVKANGKFDKPYTISLQRELFIPHNTSLAAKEFSQFEFLEKVIIDIDKVITDMVEQRLR